MRRLGLRTVVPLVLAALSAGVARGQVSHARPWASNVVVPQSRAYTMAGRAPAVQIAGVSAEVVVRDQAATTTMTIRLRNPGPGRQEAELLVPVPDRAVVREFTFQGSSSEPTAQLLPKDEARRAYEQIVAQVRDPALLEFAGYQMVRTSVFPVEPGGTQAVRLTYENLLHAEGDRVDYVLPRTESVEYGVPWSIAVDLRSSSPIGAIYSPSHRVNITRQRTGSARAELASASASDPGPFRLSFLRERDGVSASLFAYPDPKIGGGYFLLLAGLPPGEKAEKSAIRREVTLVIDRSGSMRGEKLDQAREAALQVLHGLDDGESFNVILYNEGVDAFSPKPLVKSRESLRAASEFLQGMTARGGTNIHDALLEALRQPATEDALPIVLFLTDGLPTIGQTSEVAIRDLARAANKRQRRIFTFGVGVDVNTPLLEKIADESRATATFVLPREDVEAKVAGVFKRLTGPVLADPELSIAGSDGATRRARELIPNRLPDLFDGDQIVLLGQYKGDDPLELTLRGNYRGTRRVFQFRLALDAATTRNAFVPRLWASRKIGLLVDAIRSQGASAPAASAASAVNRELVDEIVRLSTEFGILTEYTSFLAREGSDLSRKEWVLGEAGRNFNERAVQTRSGYASLNQELNNQVLKNAACANPLNKFVCPDGREASSAAVQQVCDLAFYKRQNRWVDSRLVEKEASVKPTRVVAFDSPEFRDLAARLAREGRQGSISLRGEILMLVDGQPVLIQAPTNQP